MPCTCHLEILINLIKKSYLRSTPSLYTIKHTSVPYYKYFILTIYNFSPTNMLHVGDLHFVSINGGKWCPHGHTSPTVKHTPVKESKVHNGVGPYPRPDLRISRSLHHGEARLGHEIQCP